MKQRVLTGILIIAALIPIFYAKLEYENNLPLYILGVILSLVAMSEMISMKETERKLPFEMHILSYATVLFLSFYNIILKQQGLENTKFSNINIYDILPIVFIIIAITMIIRHRFKVNDATFVLFAIFYVGLCFKALVDLFIYKSINELLFIIFIAISTDTFAYFTGYLFGKHKLCPNISPKKTIEGAVGGSLIGTILVSIFAYNTFMENKSLVFIIITTFILTIMSQFGDLIASVFKRHYKIKDYGNLFPGHGGVLDRLDSILFTALTYYYLIEIYNIFIAK